jgi:hypothetical protein
MKACMHPRFVAVPFAALVLAAAPALAQNLVPAAPTRALQPGLYVQVLDGAISVSNKAGTTNFAAGQFGFTPNVQQPPVVLPANPGIQFTPPPVFNAPLPSSSTASAKSNTVDCEVR